LSNREYDPNGYLIVKDNPITKSGVFDYMGYEIGLTLEDPNYNKIVKVYRSDEEIQKAIDSFKLKPFVNEHSWLGKDGLSVEQKGVLGTTGENPYFQSPYLKSTLTIYSEDTQELINDGKVELSAGYSCRYVPESGVYDGQAYEFKQVELYCNHLALVDTGRSGADVSVLDTAKNLNIKDNNMTLEELLKLIAELSSEDKAKLKEALATDEEVQDNEEEVLDEETEDNEEEVAKDEETEDSEEATEVAELVEEAQELILDENMQKAEEVLEVATQKAEELELKANDSLNKRLRSLKKAIAMDKKTRSFNKKAFLKEIAKRDNLAKGLTPLIGSFDHSAMTLKDVAVYGAKKLDLVCTQDTAIAVVEAVLRVKQKDVKAMDTIAKKPITSNDVKFKLWGKR